MLRTDFYQLILHKIQFYREVSMDIEKLTKLLDLIGSWSYSHRSGEDFDSNAFVSVAEEQLCEFMGVTSKLEDK